MCLYLSSDTGAGTHKKKKKGTTNLINLHAKMQNFECMYNLGEVVLLDYQKSFKIIFKKGFFMVSVLQENP